MWSSHKMVAHVVSPTRSEDRGSPGTRNSQALTGAGTCFVTHLHLGWFILSPLGATEFPFLLLFLFKIVLFLCKLRKSWGEVRKEGSFLHLSVQMCNNYSQAEF